MDEMLPSGRLAPFACAAAATERCQRPWRDLCGRIRWRLAAGDLLFWSKNGGGRVRHAVIPQWLKVLHTPRGCALGMALAKTTGGVTIAESVQFVVDLELGPKSKQELWATEIGSRLSAIGDVDDIRARCHEVMAALHNATPRRPRS